MADVDSLDEIDKTYQSIANLGVKLKALQEENSRHGQVVYRADVLSSVCCYSHYLTLQLCSFLST